MTNVLEKSINMPGGSISYWEAVGLVLVMAASHTVVMGGEWFINSLVGAYGVVCIGLAIISLSGKGDLRRVKKTSTWEGIGIAVILGIISLYGYFQLEALQSSTYQILAMGLIFLISVAIAYRD
ncbi:hypothetical protein [Methanococcus maripaludis]|uniref:Uncharacterized protein n=2 Tax=Methanococcus maripaludis TaxID=39152 RepID=A0A7J9PG02_METMI|nr:hypothetical protein [Methanococcus maripaludis]MBA2861627.1 hypothetical protein [Methanococcus maripaludis]